MTTFAVIGGAMVLPQNVLTVMSFTVDGGRIVGIESMRNPEKLTRVDLL